MVKLSQFYFFSHNQEAIPKPEAQPSSQGPSSQVRPTAFILCPTHRAAWSSHHCFPLHRRLRPFDTKYAKVAHVRLQFYGWPRASKLSLFPQILSRIIFSTMDIPRIYAWALPFPLPFCPVSGQTHSSSHNPRVPAISSHSAIRPPHQPVPNRMAMPHTR